MDTLQEPVSEAAGTVRLLTYVLNYDDLAAERSQLFWADDIGWQLRIGRGTDPDPVGTRNTRELLLPDPFMSGTHAVITAEKDERVLHDHGSRNGTYVNGARVTRHCLADGDLIEVGHSLLCYRAITGQSAEVLGACAGKPRLGPARTFCPEVVSQVLHLRRVAPSAEPVLLLAETGSGKEISAAMVHQLSGRKGAYRTVDCGAIPDNLFESTFFGHQRGAFTGASETRTGELLLADGGTLFLDEVGNLSAAAQTKLLRVLEDGKVTPVGATKAVHTDVRFIAATNSDLFSPESGFRTDLLRRLTGYVARLPPLRHRREDLGALSAHLLREAGVTKAAITPAAGRLLFSGEFPGNVRQLRSLLRSATLLAAGSPMDLAHLDLAALAPTERTLAEPTKVRREAPGRSEIEEALTRSKSNVMEAARQLRTHARQLYRWMERLALPADKYRA